MKSKASTIIMLKSAIDMAEGQIAKFQTRFNEDPAYALSWGGEVYQAAANRKVFKMILVALEDGAEIENVVSTLQDRVMSKARFPENSTSPASNLMSQCEMIAYAEALSSLKGY